MSGGPLSDVRQFFKMGVFAAALKWVVRRALARTQLNRSAVWENLFDQLRSRRRFFSNCVMNETALAFRV